jgi:uncharacterized metal-binding protein YceD (DUF177 family)
VYIGQLKDESLKSKEDSPWQLHGEVKSCIFKGVHYEMTVLTDEGYELMIQDYHAFEVGSQVGLLIKPEDIQVMKKERLCNTFDGEVLEDNQVRFLDEVWDIPERVAERFEVGEEVEVEVDFNLSAEDRVNDLNETAYIDGYDLDVDRLVYEEILLGFPMKVLCQEDCKGICKVCGANLNQGECGCVRTEPDPRMSVIRDIFNNVKEV